jgi:hypothetical protein
VPTKQNYVVVLELREMKKLFLRQEIISTWEQRYRDVSYIDDRVEKTCGRTKLILTKLSFENVVFLCSFQIVSRYRLSIISPVDTQKCPDRKIGLHNLISNVQVVLENIGQDKQGMELVEMEEDSNLLTDSLSWLS